jgi:replication-associated recombination protein RarA
MIDQIKLTEIILRHLLIELPTTNKNYWSIAHAWSSVCLLLLLKEKLKQELSTVVQEELQSLIELVESQTPLLETDFLKDLLCR